MKRGEVLGVPVSLGAQNKSCYEWIRERIEARNSGIVTFVNPHSVYLIGKVPAYRSLLERCDLILCDGVGMSWAATSLCGDPTARISFDSTSLAPVVFGLAQELAVPIYLVGGVEGVAGTMAEKLRAAYPGIQIQGAFNGFAEGVALARGSLGLSKEFSILVCAMGTVRQEEFVVSAVESGYCGLAFTCGGFFDQYCSSELYYPRWIDQLNLRWLYRIWREPRRLWRRYFMEYRTFISRSALALLFRLVPGEKTMRKSQRD